MTVESAEVHRLEVPMRRSYDTAHHRGFSGMESTLVVLHGDGGERGIGTADATPGYSKATHDGIGRALAEVVLPAVLSARPRTPNRLDRVLSGVEGRSNAKCAVEMAFLDLYGRRTGRPLHELLGGALRREVALNGWVGIDDPDAMAADARGWMDDGFESVKLKLGGDPDADVERVRAVQDACGDGLAIRADANEGYDVEGAIDAAGRLEALPLVHLEQPIPGDDLDALTRVTGATSTPIMADEYVEAIGDVHDVLCRGGADRVKLKILRMGGVLETRRALDLAGALGVECVLGHGFGLTPATSAELQLAAAHPNVFGAVESVGPLKMDDEPFEPAIEIDDGAARLPDGPGLGVDLADGRLDEFAVDSRSVERP